MKLAVLADIHGNQPALEAVIRDLEREKPDQVVVAGDLVNRGPFNSEVVETVSSSGWPCIEGNHDRLVVDWLSGEAENEWYSDPFYSPIGWVAEGLVGWQPYLESLPFELRIAIDGAPPILVVHASPRSNREGIHPWLSDAEIEEICGSVREQVMLCGHTHKSLDRRVDGCRIVNAGAVGIPFNGDPRAQYALLTLQRGDWQVDLRGVEYDRESVREAFTTRGYLDSGVAAHVFLHEFERSRSELYHFEQWLEAGGYAPDLASWRQYLAHRNA